MHPLTFVFLAFLLVATLSRLWLARRQIRNVNAHRGHVPDPFGDSISLEDHQKAADYTTVRQHVGQVETVYDAAWLVVWTLGGGFELIDRWWRGFGHGPVLTGTAVLLSCMVAMAAVSLPFDAWRTFNVEKRFGFNRSTVGLWISDLLKGLLLMLLIGGPVVAIILWLMTGAGTLWWVYAWGVWVGIGLLMSWAYPAFIAPLFNRFSALDDAALLKRIESLLDRCGFRSKGVFVMDGSRRSAHGNAYFTGLGNNKRIVFFDTLLDGLEPSEVEAVLAHELGHFRLRHVAQRLTVTFALAFAGFALLGWLSTQGWFYTALGMSTPSSHAALLLFTVAVPVFTFPLTPIGSWYSRRHEFEADEYAASQADGRALVRALVKLTRDNASTLTPDPLHSRFYDSHPPAPLRVARLSELAG